MEKKDVEQMANEHAEWYARHIASLLELTYREAFIHGYKHGKNDR